MDQATPPLSPLGLDPNGLVYFGISLVVASIIVVLFCWPKFDESTLIKNDDDYITQLLPRDLVSPREYSRGLLIYISSMLALVGALSVLGPPVLKLFSIQTTAALGATPIVVAIALVAVAPNVPVIKEIEIMIRRFAHLQAFIPAAAKAIAERLTAANFDFSQYRIVINSNELRGVKASDFDAQRGSIEYNWARLCSLCYALRSGEDEETEKLDRRLFKSYRHDLDAVYERRSYLEGQVVQFRNNPEDAALRNDLRAKIRDALQKLYIFTGCSARLLNKDREEIDKTLAGFGFKLESLRPEPTNGDLMIVGLFVMAACVLLTCFLGSELVEFGLWTPSPYFPVKAFDPFIWAGSAGCAHGASILAADRMRASLLRKERWYDVEGATRKPSIANYIRVGAVCALVGYVVLLIWGVLLQPVTWAMIEGAAPYAFMPAVTGAFYAYHLDNVELASRPRRSIEIFSQAACTGFMGFAASRAWISLGNTNMGWSGGTDFVILVAIMGFVVGASLAWYIPKNATARRYDPLLEAKENRMREVTALARERFINPAEAEQWLRTESPALQGVSPVTALAEAQNFEDIVRLLNKTMPAPQH